MDLYEQIHWSSDWNGDEVGYPDSAVVGLYSFKANPSIYFYIDSETNQILEMWSESDE